MQKFLELKREYNLSLIEDCAHSFMGKFKNRFLGTIGDFGTFSFHETKNLIGGQCGAISINSRKYIKRAKIILDKALIELLSLIKKNITLGKILVQSLGQQNFLLRYYIHNYPNLIKLTKEEM